MKIVREHITEAINIAKNKFPFLIHHILVSERNNEEKYYFKLYSDYDKDPNNATLGYRYEPETGDIYFWMDRSKYKNVKGGYLTHHSDEDFDENLINNLSAAKEYILNHYNNNVVNNKLSEGIGLVKYQETIDLTHQNLSKLPDNIPKHVSERFSCASNKLYSLKGSPIYVGGDFSCIYNNLTSLEYAPSYVGENFYCYKNSLITLIGAPTYVGGDFHCEDNYNLSKHAVETYWKSGAVKGIIYSDYGEYKPIKKVSEGIGVAKNKFPFKIEKFIYKEDIIYHFTDYETGSFKYGYNYESGFVWFVNKNGTHSNTITQHVANSIHTLEEAKEIILKDYNKRLKDTEITEGIGIAKYQKGIDLTDKNLTTLPDNLPTYTSNGEPFYCNYNELISLKGSPETIGGIFNCNHNNLKNLIGGPKYVKINYYCKYNNLESLEGAAEYVGNDFHCYKNSLITLIGAPTYVGGDFYCEYNPNLSKEEIERYYKTGAVKGIIFSDYGNFVNKLSEGIKVAPNTFPFIIKSYGNDIRKHYFFMSYDNKTIYYYYPNSGKILYSVSGIFITITNNDDINKYDLKNNLSAAKEFIIKHHYYRKNDNK